MRPVQIPDFTELLPADRDLNRQTVHLKVLRGKGGVGEGESRRLSRKYSAWDFQNGSNELQVQLQVQWEDSGKVTAVQGL